ncbi:ATP-binding protein [Sphaerisporangium sp. NPDC051011]|uniref:AlbA family DNA-binding domain-containing protein n=1 Tax=Sphaerisporangium sp. NPDC051011 TaxID=3155792 RepID=UPI0033DBA97C
MLDGELAEIVADLRTLGGDIADVEVKTSRTELPKTTRETLSAFANTHGGVLILGLDETKGFAPTGVRDPAKLAGDLASLCSTDMEPALRPLTRVHDFEGSKIIVAEVPEVDPSQRPCFYKGAGMTRGSFIRVGDGDRRLSSYEVQVMLSSRGQPREDEQGVPGTGLTMLDPVALDSLIARLRVSRPYAFKDLDRHDVPVRPQRAPARSNLSAMRWRMQASMPSRRRAGNAVAWAATQSSAAGAAGGCRFHAAAHSFSSTWTKSMTMWTPMPRRAASTVIRSSWCREPSTSRPRDGHGWGHGLRRGRGSSRSPCGGR